MQWDGILEAELVALERKLATSWASQLSPGEVSALSSRRADLLKVKQQHDKKKGDTGT
jgi:hypothetical protein